MISQVLPIDLSFIDYLIDKAISQLSKKKAPGPDGISNNIIILAWPMIRSFVISIFKDSLTLCHIPSSCQSSLGIFINKPGKSDYFLSSSWRTLNLSCNLLKVLEKVIFIYLTDVCQVDTQLDDNQLGSTLIFGRGIFLRCELARMTGTSTGNLGWFCVRGCGIAHVGPWSGDGARKPGSEAGRWS